MEEKLYTESEVKEIVASAVNNRLEEVVEMAVKETLRQLGVTNLRFYEK